MAAQPLSNAPPVAAPARARENPIDIDTRISLIEHRLVARELRLRTQAQILGQRISRAAAPRALLLKLGGLAVAGGGLVWAWRRGRHGGDAPGQPAPVIQAGGPPRLLLSLLPMAWPLLPARWRRRVSPATAAAILGVALPLIQRLRTHKEPGTDRQPPATAQQPNRQPDQQPGACTPPPCPLPAGCQLPAAGQ